MSIDHKTLEQLKAAYRRWDESKGKDIQNWAPIFGDEVDFRSLSDGRGGVEFTRRRLNRDGVMSYLQDLTKSWEMIYFLVEEYICDRDRVVALGHTSWRNRATKRVVETPKCDIWRFKAGKAIEFFEFYDSVQLELATIGGPASIQT